MSSLISNPAAPSPHGPETKKPAKAAPAPFNAAGDSANLLDFWRNPEAGKIYRHAEHLTGPVTPCMMVYARLRQAVTAAAVSSNPNPLWVMDMCCGTGLVSAYIQQMLKQTGEKTELVSADSSEAQLGVIKDKVAREGWTGTTVEQCDIMKQPFSSDSFDVVICAMSMMLIADPYKAMTECYRVTKPGGTFATSAWVTEGWVPDTADALSSLALPGQPPVCWPQNSAELTNLWGPGCWESPSFVRSMYMAAGFVDVETEIVTKWISFTGVDEWCTAFQAFMQAVPDRFWTREQKEKLKGKLMPTLRAYMEKKYQGAPFDVERTVLLARGRKPEI